MRQHVPTIHHQSFRIGSVTKIQLQKHRTHGNKYHDTRAFFISVNVIVRMVVAMVV